MPRRNRCVLPDIPCHITQRGVDRCEVFSTDQDRNTYLRLLRENLGDADVRVLGYCLMTNNVHLTAVRGREDSLSVLLHKCTHTRPSCSGVHPTISRFLPFGKLRVGMTIHEVGMTGQNSQLAEHTKASHGE